MATGVEKGQMIDIIDGSVSETRNGALRAYTKELAHYTALLIHQLFPDLTPNQLSAMGFLEVIFGALLAEQGNINFSTSLQIGGFSLQTLGNIKDGLDGPLARIITAQSPGKHDPFTGQLVDVTFDKAGEIATAWTRARTAYLKNNPAGEYAAFGVAITAALPALTRAHVESLGYAVPEIGRNLLEAMGTRTGRIILGMAATHVPYVFDYLGQSKLGQNYEFVSNLSRIGSRVSQPSIDTLNAAASLYTTNARMQTLFDLNSRPTLNQSQRKEAITRAKLLLGIELVSIGGTVLVHELLRQGYPRSEQNQLLPAA